MIKSQILPHRVWYEDKMHDVVQVNYEKGEVSIKIFENEIRIKPQKLLRPTQMADEKGVPIYEHDVLEIDAIGDPLGIVKYIEWDGCRGIVSSYLDGDLQYRQLTHHRMMSLKCKVAGNLYDGTIQRRAALDDTKSIGGTMTTDQKTESLSEALGIGIHAKPGSSASELQQMRSIT